MIEYVMCVDCGADFARDESQRWKKRCLSCWLAAKESLPQARSAAPADPLRDELRDKMRGLLSLCHPDRHGNSTLSTATTQWLLSVRERLDEPVTQ